VLLLLWSCVPDPPRPSVEPAATLPAPLVVYSRPLTGGNLAINEEGVYAAADVDGDRLLIVRDGQVETTELPAGSSPGPVSVTGDEVVLVLAGSDHLRRSSLAGDDVDEIELCADPRGVDALDGSFVVVCDDGGVVFGSSAVGAPVAALSLGEPLADASLISRSEVWVVTAREARVMRIDLDSREVLQDMALPLPEGGAPGEARGARRLRRVGDGRFAVLYQAHTTDVVPTGVLGVPTYGTGACDAVARPLVAWFDESGVEAVVRMDAILPVELAFWPEGDGGFTEPTPLVASVAIGGSGNSRVLSAYPPSGLFPTGVPCLPRYTLAEVPGYVTGLASGPDGPVVLTRQPLSLVSVAKVRSPRSNPARSTAASRCSTPPRRSGSRVLRATSAAATTVTPGSSTASALGAPRASSGRPRPHPTTGKGSSPICACCSTTPPSCGWSSLPRGRTTSRSS
jgi:hypothetical protein